MVQMSHLTWQADFVLAAVDDRDLVPHRSQVPDGIWPDKASPTDHQDSHG